MMSVYIHIPFCEQLCTYCDFCKMYYNKFNVSKYLSVLEKEINEKYKGEQVKTIYIGGGTPSCLNIDELEQLFDILKLFNIDKNVEFTFECNIESIDLDKLNFLYRNSVNRLSIGVQTFKQEHLKFLGRKHTKQEVYKKINLVKKVGFKNINLDLIYAIPGQTIDELKEDLDILLDLNIPHISTYSLIIEPHTKLFINDVNNISEDLDFEMYEEIRKILKLKNYNHYEISNFAKEGYESKHNLTYWNNLEYYGFGLGAGGYINERRYENTRSPSNYYQGNYCYHIEKIDKKTKMENELILGFRKINGINKKDFYQKYGIYITDNKEIKKLIDDGKVIDDDSNIYISPDCLYIANEILLKLID